MALLDRTPIMTATNPSLSTPWRLGVFAILAIVMVATRANLIHLGTHIGSLPDASWAVFFIAGFYLRGSVRWAFPALMALAVGVDYAVISGQGLSFWSHYCVSPAYWFLVPSYAALWFGGAWLRQRYDGLHARELGLLLVSAVAAASVCYLVSNGSYYWLSNHWQAAAGVTASFGGWMKNLGDWYLPFIGLTLVYVAIAAVLHVLATRALGAMAGHGTAGEQRR